MRRVASCASAISVVVSPRWPPTPGPACSAGPAATAAARRTTRRRTPAAASAGAITQSPVDVVRGQPVGERVLEVGQREPVEARTRVDLSAAARRGRRTAPR